HARSAPWPLVPDDQHVALLDLPVGDRGEAVFLALEHPGAAVEPEGLDARRLHHGAVRRQAAAQHREPAVRLERVLGRPDDLAVRLERVGHALSRRSTGTPPTWSSSLITYTPDGRTEAITGVRRVTASKSSRVSSTPASCAMASRCSTALVDPAVAITIVAAFRNPALGMI